MRNKSRVRPGRSIWNRMNSRSKVERAGGSRGTRSENLNGRKGGFKVVCQVDRYDPYRIVGAEERER